MGNNIYTLLSKDEAKSIGQNAIAILPLGAIEQHGPHLPINTDVILAEEFAKRIIKKWSNDYELWLMPTIPFGLSLEHSWAQGTISLSSATYSNLILELWEQIRTSCGINKILVVNGHGGNRGILEVLVNEFCNKNKIAICISHPTALSNVKSNSVVNEVHGGKSETSVILELAPKLVNLHLLPKRPEIENLKNDQNRLITDKGQTWAWKSSDERLAVDGIIGDPWVANSELGKNIVESSISQYDEIFDELINSISSRSEK
jgi:creatinine amidohydrolase/Fe(II)-dependent formamide hydrolase-like protein